MREQHVLKSGFVCVGGGGGLLLWTFKYLIKGTIYIDLLYFIAIILFIRCFFPNTGNKVPIRKTLKFIKCGFLNAFKINK